MDKPKTIAILPEEGGQWVPFKVWQYMTDFERAHRHSRIHAIMFDDRSVWDAVNGWQHLWDRPWPTGIKEPAEQPANQIPIMYVGDVEGTERWIPWLEWRQRPVPDHKGKRFHAIKFADGAVLDAQSGWRPHIKPDVEVVAIDGTGWAEAAFSDDVAPAQRTPACIYGNDKCQICG